MRRYAIYFAPEPDTELARFGDRWLNLDDPVTAEPARYGLHGTLKPPFALVDGQSEDALRAALAAFAAERKVFTLPRLKLAAIGRFLALVPSAQCPEIDTLAADCVKVFDGFRRPPSPDELAKRRQASLSPAQDALLLRLGYPYVLEEFRFHLTLTGRLDDRERDDVAAKIEALLANVPLDDVAVASLCLFEQENTATPFAPTARFPFG